MVLHDGWRVELPSTTIQTDASMDVVIDWDAIDEHPITRITAKRGRTVLFDADVMKDVLLAWKAGVPHRRGTLRTDGQMVYQRTVYQHTRSNVEIIIGKTIGSDKVFYSCPHHGYGRPIRSMPGIIVRQCSLMEGVGSEQHPTPTNNISGSEVGMQGRSDGSLRGPSYSSSVIRDWRERRGTLPK